MPSLPCDRLLLLPLAASLALAGCELGPSGPRLDEPTRARAAEVAEATRGELTAAAAATRETAATAAEIGQELASTSAEQAAAAADRAVAEGREVVATTGDTVARAGAAAREEVTATVAAAVDATRERLGDARDAAGQVAQRLVDDAALRAAITALFLADTDLRGLPIAVRVEAGVVELGGSVPSAALAAEARRVAALPDGVVRVADRLTIGTPPPAP